MKKFMARGLVAAVLATGLGVLGATTGAGTALACGDPEPTNSAAFAATLPQVRPGQSGTYVMGLQKRLAGNDNGRNPYQLDGTGYYGPKTLAAVKDFQRRNGIKASGIVGAKTWQKLVGRASTNVTVSGPVPTAGLRPGDRDAKLMPQLDNALSRIYPYQQLPATSADNHYGPQWQRLVKDFQRKNGIKASGIVGPKTWNALYRVVSVRGGWGC